MKFGFILEVGHQEGQSVRQLPRSVSGPTPAASGATYLLQAEVEVGFPLGGDFGGDIELSLEVLANTLGKCLGSALDKMSTWSPKAQGLPTFFFLLASFFIKCHITEYSRSFFLIYCFLFLVFHAWSP